MFFLKSSMAKLSSRRHGNGLFIIVEHVFNHHAGVVDLGHFVLPLHNVALPL
jgi:hypothetical protein